MNRPALLRIGSAICAAIVAIFVVGLLSLVLCSAAKAQTVGAHVLTWHDSGELNGKNPGLYVHTEQGYIGGIYKNSLEKTSVYGGYGISRATWAGEFSIMGGLITGYQKNPINPMLIPSYKSGIVRLALLPKFGTHGATGVHLALETKIN